MKKIKVLSISFALGLAFSGPLQANVNDEIQLQSALSSVTLAAFEPGEFEPRKCPKIPPIILCDECPPLPPVPTNC
ncbi:hypothetical protein EYS14_10560 [Alteromonadaceae bacterium M269]|nr:hypothetical protein EYS14_10560 [Alteromonadaceae bacterium M269]